MDLGLSDVRQVWAPSSPTSFGPAFAGSTSRREARGHVGSTLITAPCYASRHDDLGVAKRMSARESSDWVPAANEAKNA